jgi:hypothetical protein
MGRQTAVYYCYLRARVLKTQYIDEPDGGDTQNRFEKHP